MATGNSQCHILAACHTTYYFVTHLVSYFAGKMGSILTIIYINDVILDYMGAP